MVLLLGIVVSLTCTAVPVSAARGQIPAVNYTYSYGLVS